MSSDSSRIPSSSQTVGPYFRIGLEYLLERTSAGAMESQGTIELCGQVLDRDGAPVPDALLEFWTSATVSLRPGRNAEQSTFPAGFRRVLTDGVGKYSLVIERPAADEPGEDRTKAPYMIVLVFARGLLRHLISRVYLGDERTNKTDSVLNGISEERRATLIAQPDESRAGAYTWDIILQGIGETVFFAW